jgi:hypothetical protein
MTLYKSMLDFLADDCGLKNEAMNVASVEVSKALGSQESVYRAPKTESAAR